MRTPTVTSQLQQIATQATREPACVFTTLAHLMDRDVLQEASHQTSQASTPGIDGVTAQPYAEHLDEHLGDLHERLRSGRSQAPPVERVWLENSLTIFMPLGVPGDVTDRRA